MKLCIEKKISNNKKIIIYHKKFVNNKKITCVSVRLSESAKFKRSQTDKYLQKKLIAMKKKHLRLETKTKQKLIWYLVVLNLFSSATNCSYVNAVRARRGLFPLPSDFFFFDKIFL